MDRFSYVLALFHSAPLLCNFRHFHVLLSYLLRLFVMRLLVILLLIGDGADLWLLLLCRELTFLVIFIKIYLIEFRIGQFCILKWCHSFVVALPLVISLTWNPYKRAILDGLYDFDPIFLEVLGVHSSQDLVFQYLQLPMIIIDF